MCHRFYCTTILLVCHCLLASSAEPGRPTGSSAAGAEQKVTTPPAALKAPAFYTKYTSAGRYPIVASSRVSDYALREAAHLVDMMLAHRPEVREEMIRGGSRLCILAHNEYTTELPEFAWLTPKDYWDVRARGTGGSPTDPYCSCGEENLLGYPGDPYATECILIHEFAHNIHLRGLLRVDPSFDRRLKAAYDSAMAKGLWRGKYAAVNHHEYFAEGSQSWFDTNRPPDHDHNHVRTRETLIEYDPALAALCREVFSDAAPRYTKPTTRWSGHLAGYDPTKAPRFAWPARLKKAQDDIHRQALERARQAEQPAAKVSRSKLLIVAPEAFQSALEPYLAHRQREMAVEVAPLGAALASSTGVDDPERLKRFLYRAWKERGVRYVLLAGDASVLPVRYMVLDRVTAPAFDYAFYPSDLYYGDVAKADGSFDDWNAHREGFHATYFGEVRGETNKNDPINYDRIHYRAELAVGRWPVNTVEQLRTVIAKTIAFEGRRAKQPGAPRAAMIAVSGWIDARRSMDRMAASLPSHWAIEKRYFSDGRSKSESRAKPATPPPTETEVLGLLNGGVDLMVHTGHGNDTAWEKCLFLPRLKSLHNANRLGVMVSAGCSTARFATLPPYEPYVDTAGVEHKGSDHGEVFKAPPPPPAPYQKGRFNPPGLGKHLVVAGPDGAVAYFGCNTGSQPCGVTLVEGLIAAWGRNGPRRLGDCWVEAVAYYYDRERLEQLKPNADWYPPSIFFQGMKFMLYGDPTLKLPR